MAIAVAGESLYIALRSRWSRTAAPEFLIAPVVNTGRRGQKRHGVQLVPICRTKHEILRDWEKALCLDVLQDALPNGEKDTDVMTSPSV